MSLTQAQRDSTIAEFHKNFDLANISVDQVMADLKISRVKFDKVMHLQQQSLEDPWILRNYLIGKIQEQGKQPVPFTALSGDWHRHWFLNSEVIDAGQMTSGDN